MKSGDVEPWPCVEEDPNATIRTGAPEASSLATRGNDTIFLAPPFGGRQGTRLKISPADFATSLTFSIALEVTLFCCGLAASTATTLAPAAGGAGGFAASDLALSERVAWVPCARAGSSCAGVSKTSAAIAGSASDIIRRKGR